MRESGEEWVRELEATGYHLPPERRPGAGPIALLGLALGILLIGIQLWLLTLAFNLYLAGKRSDTLVAAIISGLVFLGGLAMLRVLGRAGTSRD